MAPQAIAHWRRLAHHLAPAAPRQTEQRSALRLVSFAHQGNCFHCPPRHAGDLPAYVGVICLPTRQARRHGRGVSTGGRSEGFRRFAGAVLTLAGGKKKLADLRRCACGGLSAFLVAGRHGRLGWSIRLREILGIQLLGLRGAFLCCTPWRRETDLRHAVFRRRHPLSSELALPPAWRFASRRPYPRLVLLALSHGQRLVFALATAFRRLVSFSHRGYSSHHHFAKLCLRIESWRCGSSRPPSGLGQAHRVWRHSSSPCHRLPALACE